MPVGERHIGNPYFKNIHGGIIASFLEASASLVVFDKPDEGAPLNTRAPDLQVHS